MEILILGFILIVAMATVDLPDQPESRGIPRED